MSGPGELNENESQYTSYEHKHITVDLAGKVPIHAGANFSLRHKFIVQDESGKKIPGYFTENKVINADQYFRSAVELLKTPFLGHERLFIIGEKILAHPNGVQSLVNALNRNITHKSTKYSVRKLTKEENRTIFNDPAVLAQIEKVLRDTYDITPAEYPNSLATDMFAQTYVHELLTSAIRAIDDVDIQTEFHMQTAETNVNRRNNAMSDYAELLGQPDLIAKSVPMTIVDSTTNKVMHGNFMLNAVGQSRESLSFDLPGFAGKTLEISPEGMKQISDLQILDYLCANIDRHPGNMFYKIDTSDPDKIRITGVQGIDNDASFGNIDRSKMEGRPVHSYLSLLDDIKYMNADMAKKVLALKPEDIENKIRLAGLSSVEIEAARNRLKLLQDKLTYTQTIQILETTEDWAQVRDRNQLGARDLGTKTDSDLIYYNKTDGIKTYNIFSNINNLVRNYNAYTAKGVRNPFDRDKTNSGRGRVPVVNAISITDQAGLDNHIDFFHELQKTLPKDKSSENYKGVESKLNEVVGTMAEYYAGFERDKNMTLPANATEFLKSQKTTPILSDHQRNHLSTLLQELKDEATAYITANPKAGNTDPYIHAAKSIAVYADFARESVRMDSDKAHMDAKIHERAEIVRQERERQAQANDSLIPPEPAIVLPKAKVTNVQIVKKRPPKADTTVTFAGLSRRIDAMQGRSQQEYKDMLAAFQASGDVAQIKNTRRRVETCEKLMAAAQAYIDHKLPKGRKVRLSDNEKRRVKFARDLKDYAKAHKTAAIEGQKYDKQVVRDVKTVSVFHEKYRGLADQYKNAGADKAAAAEKILQEADSFREGLENILEIADQYDRLSDVRAVCGNVLGSGISAFMQAFTECARGSNNPAVNNTVNYIQACHKDVVRAKIDARDYMKKFDNQKSRKQEAPAAVKTVSAQSVGRK